MRLTILLVVVPIPARLAATRGGSQREMIPRKSDDAGPVQSTTAPPVKLISLAVMVRAQSDAAKAAMLATSS